MKVKLQIGAGGIFSKYMFLVQNSKNINCNTIYADCIDERANKNGNPFDFVLNQTFDETYETKLAVHMGNYSQEYKLENSPNYFWYKIFVNESLEIKKEIIDSVNQKKIYDNYIGLHIRLTDMNITHPEYGVKYLENYLPIIDSLPQKPIFVASDNHESIHRLKRIYGDRIFYNEGFIRSDREYPSSITIQEDNLSNKVFWEEAFVDMLLLSMSSHLVFRTSGLAHAAIIHAKQKQTLHRI